MNIETTRFGAIEVDDSSIIRMPRGPLGFEDQTDYCLMQHRPDTNLRWLQSTQEPGLAFVVIDPSECFNDYEFEVPDADAEKLMLQTQDDALVLVMVTINRATREVSANLAAPVVINSKELVGMQVVLQDNRYTVAHPLLERDADTIRQTHQEQSEEDAAMRAA